MGAGSTQRPSRPTERPTARARSFPALTERRTVELIQGAAKTKAAAGSELRKVGDYYATFMDEAAIEARGLKPLRAKLDRISAVRTSGSWRRF